MKRFIIAVSLMCVSAFADISSGSKATITSGGNSAAVSSVGSLYITPTDNYMIDAFGRQRVSEPHTLFDSKQLNEDGIFWSTVINGGQASSTYVSTNAATLMTVATNNEYVIRQTKMRFNYQPGKSQQILTTFVLGAGVDGVTRRVGYFNSTTNAPYTNSVDGIYIEQNGTNGVYLCVSKSGWCTQVHQSNWNVDPMDGTGPSGVTLDWSKAQIGLWDFEWLGVGRVRAGVVVDGKIYYTHYFNHANNISSVYMSSPNHSIRYEIRSSGGAGSMQHICSSVSSEGGSQEIGQIRAVSTAGTHMDMPTENVMYALLGVRLSHTNIDTTVKILDLHLALLTANHEAEWTLVMNPTVSGTPTWNAIDRSAVQYCIGTTNTMTGGQLLHSGFFMSGGVASGGSGSESSELESAVRLGMTVDGVRDTIFIGVRPINGSTAIDVEGSFSWREMW